jgi:hypothetical protein
VLLFVAGCTASTGEELFMRHQPNQTVAVRKAPYNGRYRLYAPGIAKPTTRTATPVLVCSLSKGAQIGFEKDSAQRLVAVAGEGLSVLAPLAPGYGQKPQPGYAWTMQPDPGQIDPVKTTLLIVGVGAIGAGIGVAVAGAAAGLSFALPAAAL